MECTENPLIYQTLCNSFFFLGWKRTEKFTERRSHSKVFSGFVSLAKWGPIRFGSIGSFLSFLNIVVLFQLEWASYIRSLNAIKMREKKKRNGEDNAPLCCIEPTAFLPNGKNMFKISTHCQTNSNLFPHLTSMDPGIQKKKRWKKKQQNHDCENKDRNEKNID